MTTIITKNKATPSSAPLPGDLEVGELAVNTADKKLYTKDSSGNVVRIEGRLDDGAITNSTLRWDGSEWVESSFLRVTGSQVSAGSDPTDPESLIETNSINNDHGMTVSQWGTNTALEKAELKLRRAVSGEIGTHNDVLQNARVIGAIEFEATDGTQFGSSAAIRAITTNTHDSSRLSSSISFLTVPTEGSTTFQELARLTGPYGFFVGKSTINILTPGSRLGPDVLTIAAEGAENTALRESVLTNYSSGVVAYDRFRDGADIKGSITYTGGAVSFNTTSDYRLKTEYGKATGAVARIASTPVYDAAYNSKPDARYSMFMAHELAEQYPEHVIGEKDGEEMQQVNLAGLVPELFAAIKELTQRIEALEA